MNSKFKRTNFGLFTLERCDDYNFNGHSRAWRVASHKIFGWHPVWGPFMFTRLSAVIIWLGYVWEDVWDIKLPRK